MGPTRLVAPLAKVCVAFAVAVLLYTPAPAITSTCKKHEPAAPVPVLARPGTVPPLRATEVEPASAVMVGVPQVLEALGGVATRI